MGFVRVPGNFWKYITKNLESYGLKQSRFDPCLFIGPDVMCIVYVDDLIFWSRDVANIDRVGMELCKLGVALEQEEDAAGFLGVDGMRQQYWAARDEADWFDQKSH